MRAKKLLTSGQIFWYAVPARTVTKKALGCVGLGHIKWTHGQLWSVCLSVCVSVCLLDETMSPK